MRLNTVIFVGLLAHVAGFDFDPSEFLSNAQNSPQVINLDTSASLEYTLSPNLNANSATELLAQANALSVRTNALVEQIAELAYHFHNDTTGSDYSVLNNLTARISVLTTSLSAVKLAVGPINNAQFQNNALLKDITSVLTCLTESSCSAGFNCSNPTDTEKTVSGTGQSGEWNFPNKKEIPCTLDLVSTVSNGFWVNLTLAQFEATDKGSVEITDGTGKTTKLTEDGDVTDIQTLPITITITGEVSFILSYVTYNPCDTFDCGNGTCYLKADNSKGCRCEGCWSLDKNGICATPKPSPCDTYGSMCTATGGTCNADDSCQYYCVCPGVADSCTTNKWCDGTCQTSDKLNAVQPKKKWWYWF